MEGHSGVVRELHHAGARKEGGHSQVHGGRKEEEGDSVERGGQVGRGRLDEQGAVVGLDDELEGEREAHQALHVYLGHGLLHPQCVAARREVLRVEHARVAHVRA